jgi:DNA-binding IclR family transcriptional regulator
MSNKYRTSDLIQGKVLAALPWEGGCKTEAVARYASLDEDTVRRALEDLVRRRMVTIDDQSYWRKKELAHAA